MTLHIKQNNRSVELYIKVFKSRDITVLKMDMLSDYVKCVQEELSKSISLSLFACYTSTFHPQNLYIQSTYFDSIIH